MTGMNPGKHGIFHFLEPQPGSYAMRYSNAGSRRSRTIWQILSEAGVRVGSVNVPFTFPPEKCTAFQISGMDTPSEKRAFLHPPELRDELERALGTKLDLEIRYLGFMSTDERRDAVLDGMARLDEQWTRVGLHLLEKRPADVMMLTFMSIDTVQHYFWHYMDEQHFQHDRRAHKNTVMLSCAFTSGLIPRSAGFWRSFHRRRTSSLSPIMAAARSPIEQRLIRSAYQTIRGALTSGQKKKLASLLPALRGNFETAATSFANIDWSRTKAYCSEVLASPPSIWINLKGIRPAGIVEPGDYEGLRDFLIAKIAELRDPRDGSPMIPRVFKREELFQGPFANEAPDLILDWWSDHAFQTGPSFPEDPHKPVTHVRPRAPMTEPEWSGTHRLDGIVICSGPAVRKGASIQGARLMDMAPTLLHLMGQKIPAGMDGRVIADFFTPEFLAAHPVAVEGVPEMTGTADAAPATPYSAEEASQVEERLKALGYID